MAAGLTEKQRRFCDEYLIDLNATRAYMAAYPRVKSEESAHACAAKLLRNATVESYLKKRMKDRQERTQVKQDDVLRELASIALLDITDIVSVKDGKVCIANTDELPPEKRKMISGIKEGQYGLEIKFYDRLKALEMLCKHLGMFDQKKDELDRKEQEARIAKLRSDTRTVEDSGEGGIIFMPTMADRPQAPEDGQ